MERSFYAVASAVFVTIFAICSWHLGWVICRVLTMPSQVVASYMAGLYLPVLVLVFFVVACGAGIAWTLGKAFGNNKLQPPSFF